MAYVESTGGTYSEPMAVNQVVEYHDRVRWGPIFAGIAVAISTQLVLSALGSALGLSSAANGAEAGDVGRGIGIWSIISLLISLFAGGWILAQTCGPMNKKTALLNGLILWATTLALGSWLLAMGVSGAFGAVASNAGAAIDQIQEPGGVALPDRIPQVTTEQAQDFAADAARAAWSFLLGSLFGLVAAIVGSSVGARKPRVHT